jgi:hypothetical protein
MFSSALHILIYVTVAFNCIGCVGTFVASALYCYKILGHGTTPCPWMMKALPFNQSQSISYEVTQSFKSISLSSRSSQWYHQASTMPSSSSTIPTRNLG